MEKFNVIVYDFNAKKFKAYDVIPYFVREYNEQIEKHEEYPDEKYYNVPESFDDFKKFIISKSQYQFWARCEYEIILVDWPNHSTSEKWDVHQQIMMNLDIITNLVMKSI